MTVYSPSQTKEYLACPARWAIRYREHWRPRTIANRDIVGILGSAFAAGVAHYHRALVLLDDNPDVILSDLMKSQCHAAAYAEMSERMGELNAHRKIVSSTVQASHDLMRHRVTKAISSYIDAKPIPPTWRIRMVETDLGEERCRPDLVAEIDGQGLAVVDIKTKISTKYLANDIERLHHNHYHQMAHYEWRVGEYAGHPVRWRYIIFVVMEPRFSVHLVPQECDEAALGAWLASARTTWRRMDEDLVGSHALTLNTGECIKYGVDNKCEYLDVCPAHVGGGFDPQLMVYTHYTHYQKEPR